jgi:hypothetical protein
LELPPRIAAVCRVSTQERAWRFEAANIAKLPELVEQGRANNHATNKNPAAQMDRRD